MMKSPAVMPATGMRSSLAARIAAAVFHLPAANRIFARWRGRILHHRLLRLPADPRWSRRRCGFWWCRRRRLGRRRGFGWRLCFGGGLGFGWRLRVRRRRLRIGGTADHHQSASEKQGFHHCLSFPMPGRSEHREGRTSYRRLWSRVAAETTIGCDERTPIRHACASESSA